MSGVILLDDRIPCPACGHGATLSEPCMLCDGSGSVPAAAAAKAQGTPQACRECNETGYRRWCPRCGEDFYHAQRVASQKGAAR